MVCKKGLCSVVEWWGVDGIWFKSAVPPNLSKFDGTAFRTS